MTLEKITSFLQGRTTSFCVAFFIAGNVLHWYHRLDTVYIGFMTALMGFVIGHSIKEDHYAKKEAEKTEDKG